MLIKGWAPSDFGLSRAPALLPFSAGIGGVTLIGAAIGLVLGWTEFLRGYYQVIIDIVVLLSNVVGGVVSNLIPREREEDQTDRW